ncbi:MAG: ribosome biogenesis GTPase Der [candidate division Zixibacteria bacterium]
MSLSVPLPIVAIIGRPNVGKSTLFNRLVKTHQAIVDDTPGITRDRLYRECSWNGVDFMLVDTGGLLVGADDILEAKVTAQARVAIDQADLIVFLIDSQVGALEEDLKIARDLKRVSKKVIIAPNKVDSMEQEAPATEFYSLGFKSLIPVSAANGLNTGDLLDEITANLPKGGQEEEDVDIRVAIVGRPNVGKSSLVNTMTGKNVTIVADLPGTTRDAIDTKCEANGKRYLLIDTAGLKKKTSYKDQLEFYTALRTLRALGRCDIAVLLIDSLDGLVGNDLKIANEAMDLHKGLIFVYNKWDIAEKDPKSVDKISKALAEKVPEYSHVPILFISALTGLRVNRVWEKIDEVSLERKKRVETSELNKFITAVVAKQPPAARRGKFIKIYYATQAEGDPPTFIFFSNHPELLDTSYKRYIENNMRATFGFDGVPLKMVFKRRK